MAIVKFEDNSLHVSKLISSAVKDFLYEAGNEILSGTIRNSRVDTGQTKGSYECKVIDNTAYIGSNYENAIWEEYGTGEYALYGNGRQGGWAYQDPKGEWHYTHGKKPNRPLYRSMQANMGKIEKQAIKALHEVTK